MRKQILGAIFVCVMAGIACSGGTASSAMAGSSSDEPYEYVNFDPDAPFPSGEAFEIPSESAVIPAPVAAAPMPVSVTSRALWSWSSATHPAGSA